MRKICTKCKIKQSLSNFFRRGEDKKKYRSHCKKCCAVKSLESGRRWYSRHKEEFAKQRREKYAANPEKYRAQALASYNRNIERKRAAQREYYYENREAILKKRSRSQMDPEKRAQEIERSRKWREANPEIIKKYNRDYHKKYKKRLLKESSDRQKKRVEECHPGYIKTRIFLEMRKAGIDISREEIPEKLVKIKQKQLKLSRYVKNKSKILPSGESSQHG